MRTLRIPFCFVHLASSLGIAAFHGTVQCLAVSGIGVAPVFLLLAARCQA
jgi:hypothetical protein